MSTKLGSAGTLVVAAATATCGLFLLSGVAPSSAGAGSVLPTAATTAPPDESTTTTTTSTTTTTTTTTITTTTTSTTVLAATPVPLSVAASNTVVGAGGVITFEGTCAANADSPLGPVIVWIVRANTTVVDTGVTASSWTYQWTAPTDVREFGSFTFQFWCGDPSGFEGGYPAGLQQHVDMVASAAPPTTTVPPIASDPPTALIPETG